MLNWIKDRKIWARVHFIPDLKVGEFVTLRTPNVLNAFDEDDYDLVRKNHDAGSFSQQFMEDKFKVYYEYIAFVDAAAEDNEQILLKLDRLLLEISGLNSIESGQLEQMPGMVEIDNLIKQARYYKN